MSDPMLRLPGLSSVSVKKIVVNFDGGLLSSVGGVLALREIEQRRLAPPLSHALLLHRDALQPVDHITWHAIDAVDQLAHFVARAWCIDLQLQAR